MSGEIGFNIQEEILKRLHVFALLRFRCVCKAWRWLIDSPYFIAAHAVRQDKCKHLLVRYVVGAKAQYVYIADDDTFPQQKFVPTRPLAVQLLKSSSIVGCCNGLVCLDGYYYNPEKTPMAVIWNPAIRKAVAIAVPGMAHEFDQTAFGFGVCPVTNDPKIVMFPQLAPLHEIKKKSEINDPREVMVYTLSSGKWRSPSGTVPSKSIRVNWNGQVMGRFMYWSGFHQMAADRGVKWTCNLILSFDMTNDTFQVIQLPRSLALRPPFKLCISKIRESLVLLEDSFNSEKTHCNVWMMENGVQKSFTKLFTISTQHGPIRALGFKKSGMPIMEVGGNRHEESEIVVYEPNSAHLNDLEIRGLRNFSSVSSYMETLLLLGSSD